MRHNFNPYKVKSKNSYAFAEIAELFKINKQTVQTWHKQGLKVIDEKTKPYLVYGEVLRSFLKARKVKRKVKLNEGEFYCTKCRAARLSAGNALRIEYTQKKMGKNANMALIKGNCEECGTVLTMFSSDRKIKEMFTTGKVIMVHGKGLTGNECPPLNTYIIDESKSESFQYLQLIKKSC